jgi:hypothetical protein
MIASSKIRLLQEILQVLQNSSTAEETSKAKDPLSKSWASYHKVSSKYDDEMLERCNGNMDIVLIFVRDFRYFFYTHPTSTQLGWSVLCRQHCIHRRIPAEPYRDHQYPFSTAYPDLNLWSHCHPASVPSIFQLLFFQLMDVGACIRELLIQSSSCPWCCPGQAMARSLQDTAPWPWIIRRPVQAESQDLSKLQQWQLENMLQSFPVLLQISVMLFGLSIGAAMWTRQKIISILIIGATAFGMLFHVFAIVASLISPDCLFQTPVSL